MDKCRSEWAGQLWTTLEVSEFRGSDQIHAATGVAVLCSTMISNSHEPLTVGEQVGTGGHLSRGVQRRANVFPLILGAALDDE